MSQELEAKERVKDALLTKAGKCWKWAFIIFVAISLPEGLEEFLGFIAGALFFVGLFLALAAKDE